MARVFAVLKALARAFFRDQKSLESVAGNNFFIVTALLLREAGGFIYLLVGLVLLFPLSTDPLRKIPSSRLALWPLDRRDRWILRGVSPWVNPVSWAIVGLAVWAARGKVTPGLAALAAGLAGAAFLLSDVRLGGNARLPLPDFPGRWDQLIRKNLRQMMATLDFYCGLLLSVSAAAYRILGPPLPAEALLAITILVVLAFSSYAQSLFGLDGSGGRSRYRLLALRGWELLGAKDAAFLLIVIPLTLPLAPLAGIGAALVALAMGHEPSVGRRRPQVRWRFSGGSSLMFGLLQAVLMASAAAGIYFSGVLVLVPCLAAWAGSIWYYGRRLD